jgi:glycosyltransferase involved in cell wall biosynthesis
MELPLPNPTTLAEKMDAIPTARTGQKPKVSIIIATYNSAATVAKCLDSIVAQTYPNLEIVVMDGGSKDGTQAIVERYGRHIAYWESKPDKGVYHAWNKALDHFSGDWFCFLGSDDYFCGPDVLEKAMDQEGLESLDLIIGVMHYVDASGKVTKVMGRPWDWGALKKYHNILHSGLLHNRSLYLKHGKFSEEFRIAGDYEYLLRFGRGIRYRFIREPMVSMGNQGMSRSQVGRVLRETYAIQRRHPEIGPLRARINYAIAYAKHAVRTLLGRKY